MPASKYNINVRVFNQNHADRREKSFACGVLADASGVNP
jgi:hypothetical protein